MAVAFDSAVAGNGGTGATTLTFAFNNVAGNALAVCISWGEILATVSSVTYNAVGLTQVAGTYGGSGIYTDIWALAAPATGSNNVVITMSHSVANDLLAGAISASGVDQTTPVIGGVNASGASVNVSCATGDLAFDLFTYVGSPSPGSGQTQRWSVNGVATHFSAGSTEAGAASVTMDWTGGTPLYIAGAAFKASAGGGGRTTKNTRAAPLGVEVGMGWRMH